MNTIHELSSAPLSPFLAMKKLEFLHNTALHLDRDLLDTDFFSDVATLIPSRDEALRLCAESFAIDDHDKWGCKPKRHAPGDDMSTEPARRLATEILDGPQTPDGEDGEDDLDFPDLPDDPDLCDPSSEVLDSAHDHSQIPDDSPFRKDRPIYLGLESVWRGTDGIEPLRRNVAELVGAHLLEARTKSPARRDPVRKHFRELVDLLHLSKIEADLLVFLHLFYMQECDWFRRFSPSPFPTHQGQIAFIRVLAGVLDARVDRVREALSGDAPLFRYGLVDENDFDLARNVSRLLSGVGKGDLRSAFYRPIETEPLPWDYFPPALREHGETIEALVRGTRDRGLDILLHGVAGAGKTSFARALAEHLGMRPVAVAVDETEGGDTDGSPRRRRDPTATGGAQAAFRLGALAVAEKQCDPARDLLVIDEADTLLFAVGANRLNRALDAGRCVRIWLGNLTPGDLPDSNLRRFDYAIEFEPLGPHERASIWRNAVARFHLDGVLADDDLREFSERFPVSAGGVSRVCENLAASGVAAKGHDAALHLANRLLESHARLLGVKYRPGAAPKRVSAGYVLDGLAIKGDVSLRDLLAASREHLRRLSEDDEGDGAARRDPPRLNILLSGPPGCGKTEFVRWLGEQLGRKVVALGASDLKDKFVGETEKRIARAFREAERDGAVLFFDEVDSFLRSRAAADHAWEISETNELLARLEDFKGLFVAATNFPSSLDPAVLRRFTFKMSFGYLDDAGKRTFFQRFFGDPLTDDEAAELDAIPNLCPGDFRTVRQLLDYLPGGATNARRLAALREESARKAALPPSDDFGTSPRRAVGF